MAAIEAAYEFVLVANGTLDCSIQQLGKVFSIDLGNAGQENSHSYIRRINVQNDIASIGSIFLDSEPNIKAHSTTYAKDWVS